MKKIILVGVLTGIVIYVLIAVLSYSAKSYLDKQCEIYFQDSEQFYAKWHSKQKLQNYFLDYCLGF